MGCYKGDGYGDEFWEANSVAYDALSKIPALKPLENGLTAECPREPSLIYGITVLRN